jgi:hypothetical protein
LLIHAKIGASMGLEHVEFFKRPLIQEKIDPFSGGHSAERMQFVDSLLTTAEFGLGPEFFQIFESFDGIHGFSLAK